MIMFSIAEAFIILQVPIVAILLDWFLVFDNNKLLATSGCIYRCIFGIITGNKGILLETLTYDYAAVKLLHEATFAMTSDYIHNKFKHGHCIACFVNSAANSHHFSFKPGKCGWRDVLALISRLPELNCARIIRATRNRQMRDGSVE
jgi:hypothetical protein